MPDALEQRIERLDWPAIMRALEADGVAITRPLLPAGTCRTLATMFDEPARFRKTIDLARFDGRGAYRYFRYPLPAAVETLRHGLYPRLVPLARAWAKRLRLERDFPPTLEELLAMCHAHGQRRQTCVLLRYQPGGFNALHRDAYGEIDFPLQAAICLSRADRDYRGGELVILEEQSGHQPRAHAIRAEQGALVLFPTNLRPARARRRTIAVETRHGLSTVTAGARCALGLVFTDTKLI